MKKKTNEWHIKAENDLLTGIREYNNKNNTNYDAVCYHAQQSAEKYLKSFFEDLNLHIPHTHDITALISDLKNKSVVFDINEQNTRELSFMATEVRYPGFSANKDAAFKSLCTALEVRNQAATRFKVKLLNIKYKNNSFKIDNSIEF